MTMATGKPPIPEGKRTDGSLVGGSLPDQRRNDPILARSPKWDEHYPAGERAPDEAWDMVVEPDWRVDEGRQCRFGSPYYGYCRRPSVAAHLRGSQWWAYCEKHTFMRWVEDGQVWVWRIKPTWWRKRGDGEWEFRQP